MIYYCETCKEVAKPYHGDPGDPTCQKCGEPIVGMKKKIVLKLAKYIIKRDTHGKT